MSDSGAVDVLPPNINMTETSNKELFIIKDNCEYFTSPDVTKVVGKLTNGARYTLTSISDDEYNGFNWGVVSYNNNEYFVAIIKDRCKIVNKDSDNSVLTVQRALFPLQYLRITQDENCTYSHTGSLAMDIGGKDTGIDKLYAPCDMRVIRIVNGSSHETYCESVYPVMWADGSIDYMSFTFMHDNYINSNMKVGAVIQQGVYFFDEGGFGKNTINKFGTHVHMEVSKGKSTHCQYRNSWGTYVTANQVHIYNALFIGSDCTVINGRGHSWISTSDKLLDTSNNSSGTVVPIAFKKYGVKPMYKLNIRKGAGTNYSKTGGYAMPVYTYTILEESADKQWGRTSIGWIYLPYTKKI